MTANAHTTAIANLYNAKRREKEAEQKMTITKMETAEKNYSLLDHFRDNLNDLIQHHFSNIFQAKRKSAVQANLARENLSKEWCPL